MFGAIMSQPDEMIKIFLINNTRIPLSEVEKIAKMENPKDAKMLTALEITKIYDFDIEIAVTTLQHSLEAYNLGSVQLGSSGVIEYNLDSVIEYVEYAVPPEVLEDCQGAFREGLELYTILTEEPRSTRFPYGFSYPCTDSLWGTPVYYDSQMDLRKLDGTRI
jgi:hypothetical protein